MEIKKLVPLAALSAAVMVAACSTQAKESTAPAVKTVAMTDSQKTNSLATNGIVTSPNYLATQAGLDVLRRGGNAVDAAIATAATLAVVYPQMCTLGGDNFWLIYNSKTGELKALNASGRSGEKATIDFYKSKGFEKIPSRGYYAANTVPGVVSGWDEAYKMSVKDLGTSYKWADILKTPIEYA